MSNIDRAAEVIGTMIPNGAQRRRIAERLADAGLLRTEADDTNAAIAERARECADSTRWMGVAAIDAVEYILNGEGGET